MIQIDSKINIMEEENWLDSGDSSLNNKNTTISFDGLDVSENNVDSSKNKNAQESSSSSRVSFVCGLLTVVSLLLLILFVYSASVQANDSDGLQWTVYYSFVAAVPALYLVFYLCSCGPAAALAIYVLSTAVGIWSIVVIVISALKLQEVSNDDGEETGTTTTNDIGDVGDNPNQTVQQEVSLELGGAAIGLVSSVYHATMTLCCVSTRIENSTQRA